MSARVEGWLVGVAAALGVALVGVWLVRTHPFVGMESASYLSNVLDGRPFLVQLFDVQHNDLGNYQARELSYATDLLDAGAVAWWFRWSGHFEALSLSHLVMCAVVVATSVSWLRGRALNLGAAAGQGNGRRDPPCSASAQRSRGCSPRPHPKTREPPAVGPRPG